MVSIRFLAGLFMGLVVGLLLTRNFTLAFSTLVIFLALLLLLGLLRLGRGGGDTSGEGHGPPPTEPMG